MRKLELRECKEVLRGTKTLDWGNCESKLMFFTLAWVLQLSDCLPHIHAPALMLCSPSNLLVRHLVSQVLSQDISLDNEDSSTLKVATHIVPKWIGLASLLTTQDKFNYFDSYFPPSLLTLGANEKKSSFCDWKAQKDCPPVNPDSSDCLFL